MFIERRAFSTICDENNNHKVRQITAMTLYDFNNDTVPYLIKNEITSDPNVFVSGIMTHDQNVKYPNLLKELKEMGFVITKVFRNKHIGNVLIHLVRFPQKLVGHCVSEDGLYVSITG